MLLKAAGHRANSWRAQRDLDGRLTWRNDQETVTRQPARSFRQRVEDVT
jgi:hypothetical protein